MMPNQQHGSSAIERLLERESGRSDLDRLLQDTRRTLSNLDFEHRFEIKRIESSRTDPALKNQIVASLKRRHNERCEPYFKVIAELQKHVSSAPPREIEMAS